MLLLEVLSYHSPLDMQQLLLRKWPPTKAGMKNVLNHVREVEVYINLRR
jgi:hypothetical protein